VVISSIQRCTVHKLRNLTAHAPKRLIEEIKADFKDMVYAATAAAVMASPSLCSQMAPEMPGGCE